MPEIHVLLSGNFTAQQVAAITAAHPSLVIHGGEGGIAFFPPEGLDQSEITFPRYYPDLDPRPVLDLVEVIVASRLPATLILAGSSVGVAALLGVAAGMYAGLRPGTRLTQALMFLWSGLLAVPNFWLGLILVDVFAVNLHWLPAVGFGGVSALIMPVLAIAARLIALIAQVTRAEFEDLRREPFVTVARAKGLSFERVAFRHMLRPALVPILTMIGLQAGYLLGGSVVIENVFAYPGMGQLLLSAVNTRDYPLVEGITLTFVILFLALNLLVDLAYTWLDPRVRYA